MREEEKQLEITRLPCTGLGSGVLKECTAVGYPGLTKSLLLLPWWPEEILALLWCPHAPEGEAVPPCDKAHWP